MQSFSIFVSMQDTTFSHLTSSTYYFYSDLIGMYTECKAALEQAQSLGTRMQATRDCQYAY